MLPLLLVSSDSVPYSSAGYYAKEYCRENIARCKVPECVDFVEEHPMMASARLRNTSCERTPSNYTPDRRGAYEQLRFL